MRTFELNTKNADEEIAVLGDPEYRSERPAVLDLVRRLQSARSPAEFFDLQQRLIVQAMARQRLKREIREHRSEIGERMRVLAQQVPKPVDDLSDLQQQMEHLPHIERVSEALRHTILALGDGIAWKTMRYDRAALTIYGRGQRVAHFADGVGWQAELHALGRLWLEEGTFAIHNDLTTCLRHGDLTIPPLTEPGVYVLEVKAGARPDETLQTKRLGIATDLLNTGRAVAEDGQALRLVRLPTPYRTSLQQLRAAIAKARRQGIASFQASPCLWVDVIAFASVRGGIEDLDRRWANAPLPRSWRPTDLLFDWHATVRRMRDRSYSFGALAPLSIFPLPAEDVADLLLGFVDFRTRLNARVLEATLRRDDRIVKVIPPPASGDQFLHVELRSGRRKVELGISPQIREQMMIELMTPSNVSMGIDGMAEALAADPGPDGEGHVAAYGDEARVWES